ncbi:hypothetical protein C8R45DRAFT_1220756 [Mycena sanguinolenta]|nr:hypothetical protein C8R45DRAFT_1220756 [Mycena sanguinolenta]
MLGRLSRKAPLATSTLLPPTHDPSTQPREEEVVDVCIVGGGPAGRSAAIRLKTSDPRRLSRTEIGSHIWSGAVIEPTALDTVSPDWHTREDPLSQPITWSEMHLLTKKRPIPLQMGNKGN